MKAKLQKDAAADNSLGASATSTVPHFGTKRDVAAMLQMSIRSVDNYLNVGLPVIALSKRRLRFDLGEVRGWFKTRYGVQRRGPAKSKTAVVPEQTAESAGAA